MRVILVGVKKSEYRGKDQTQKVGFSYCGLKEFTRYEMENAQCEGQDVIREWSNIDFNVHPGDEVEFIYEPGFQDKATLVDIKVIKFADNPFPDKEKASEKSADPKAKAGA